MNRLQKKCFFASAALHLLLFALLLVGPAFLISSSKRADDLPLLRMIPTKLIDEAAYGGAPQLATAPPAVKGVESPPLEPRKEPVVQPPVRDPDPLPQIPEPPRKPPVEKIEKPSEAPPQTKPFSKTKNLPDVPKTEPPAPEKITQGKHAIVPDLNPAVRGPKENSLRKSKENDRARGQEKARAAQQAWKSDIASSLKALQGSLSNSATIEPVGTGGEAYANYAQAIKTIYTDAWITPEDVNDENATVQVTVIIARDGRVLSSSILKHSGIPALDRSVQNVLDRVKKVPSFPEGANDLQRTFRLNFNLKSKRTLG